MPQGKDHTLYALEGGRVVFSRSRHTDRRTVSVEAVPEANEPLALRVPTHLLRAARQAARLQLQAASA